MKIAKGLVGLFAGLAVLIVVLGAASVWTYGIFMRQWDAPFVRQVAAAVHFPAARVGSRWIPYTDYLHNLDAERSYLAGPAAKAQGLPGEPTTEMKKEILERLIRIAVVEDMAKEQSLDMKQSDIDSAFDTLMARAGTSTTPGEIDAFLKDEFGWNRDEFKQNVLRPALLESGLKQKKGSDQAAQDALGQEILDRMDRSDVGRFLRFK